MTVQELITFLQRSDPKTPVLVRGHDHSYTPAYPPEVTTALLDGDGYWIEDHGEEATPQAGFGKRVTVVVLA